MSRVTLITDGSAPSTALGRWLAARAGIHEVVAALGPTDVSTVVQHRRAAKLSERLATLAPAPAGADVDGSAAQRVVSAWLGALPPIEARARGAEEIEACRAAGKPGAEELDRLLGLISPVPVQLPRGRRGRPKGSNPFAGTGFSVSTTLLQKPDRRWTERELAEAVGHSPSLVHRTLEELARRGYVGRTRGATFVREPLLMRDDLLAAWRAKLGAVRPARHFMAPKKKDVREAVFRAAKARGVQTLLAGNSAAEEGSALVGQPTTLYLAGDPAEVLAGAFEPAQRVGDVMVWEAPERGVFLSPDELEGYPVTNRVVTWLDLRLMGTDRTDQMAEYLWESTA